MRIAHLYGYFQKMFYLLYCFQNFVTEQFLDVPWVRFVATKCKSLRLLRLF